CGWIEGWSAIPFGQSLVCLGQSDVKQEVRGMMGLGTGRGWRRLTGRRLAILLSLVAIILASVSVTIFVIRPAAAITPPVQATSNRPDDPRAAGAYFQLRHYGKKRPSADARTKALAQATKLPRFQVKNPHVRKPSTKGAHN